MNFKEAAEAFQQACAGVAQAIKTSPYKAEHWMKKLGFAKSPGAYYARLKTGNWEPEHLVIIGQLLEKS